MSCTRSFRKDFIIKSNMMYCIAKTKNKKAKDMIKKPLSTKSAVTINTNKAAKEKTNSISWNDESPKFRMREI